MAGIAIKFEDLDKAKHDLHGIKGAIVEADDIFYFVTAWTQERADSLYYIGIDYELVLFDDPDSLMLKAKMEAQAKLRDQIIEACGGEEEARKLAEFVSSRGFMDTIINGVK
jgi:hypothetical protein